MLWRYTTDVGSSEAMCYYSEGVLATVLSILVFYYHYVLSTVYEYIVPVNEGCVPIMVSYRIFLLGGGKHLGDLLKRFDIGGRHAQQKS